MMGSNKLTQDANLKIELKTLKAGYQICVAIRRGHLYKD
ncbi:hypothetical protein Patl1_22588 [Pistacia atlantica]|uniref:Uncharacterized protein n=1 Tax=Pistacia atlantica TaxID=434234 RepID=A0ACC0ZW40_9ROSI|nr:hypothetical protein Patl1_22588 [Pistacia atlantica]